MKKRLLIIGILPLFFFCQKKADKGTAVQPREEAVVAEESVVVEEVKDRDYLFAKKIMGLVYENRGGYAMNPFEKQNWKIANRLDTADLDIIPYLQKESHYYAISERTQFCHPVAIDYYKFNNKEVALAWIEDHKQLWTWEEKEEDDKYDRRKAKMASDSICYVTDLVNNVYWRDSTVFMIRFDGGYTFVRKVMQDFNKGIQTDSTIAFFEIDSQEQQKIERMPFIDKKLSKRLAPKMKRWLSAHKLDLNKFKVYGPGDMEDWDKDVETIYYREFDPKDDDVYLPQTLDYSPDRSMYVNIPASMGAYMENDTLKYYGGDDCQEIYLTSRTLKKSMMILWLGSSPRATDCFWIDNNSFVLVGCEEYGGDYPSDFFILYDLANKTVTRGVYQYVYSEDISENYFEEYNLPFRGYPLLMD